MVNAYRRASFYDYPAQEVPTAWSTRSRLFSAELRERRSENKTQGKGVIRKLLGVAAADTLFHLPNHFRQNVLINSNRISFENKSDALLDLMNLMFHR